jgi:hypothetical protein
LIQKKQGTERLVLRRGANVPFNGRCVRNWLIAAAPICRGCRLPWNRMNRLLPSA